MPRKRFSQACVTYLESFTVQHTALEQGYSLYIPCTGGLGICTTADFSAVKVLQSHASILVTADREGQKTNR